MIVVGFSFREGRLSAGRPERAGESVRRGLLRRPGALYLLVTLALIGAYAVALPLAAAHSSSTGKGFAFISVAFGMIPLSAFVAVSAALSVLGGAFRTMKWAVPGTYVCAIFQLIPPLMLLLEGGVLISAMGLDLAALTYAYGDVGELSRRLEGAPPDDRPLPPDYPVLLGGRESLRLRWAYFALIAMGVFAVLILAKVLEFLGIDTSAFGRLGRF